MLVVFILWNNLTVEFFHCSICVTSFHVEMNPGQSCCPTICENADNMDFKEFYHPALTIT